jgi:hypothetical protein
MSRRRITDKERADFSSELATLEIRRVVLKNEARDSSKAIRDEVKIVEKRIWQLASALNHGAIDEDDQLRLVEAG